MIKTRPFTFMLVAVSLDGKISPKRRSGQPNPVGPAYIDEEIMRLHNSQRAAVDGIMVGLNCILMDNARLTLREGGGRSPTRIVLDGLAEPRPGDGTMGFIRVGDLDHAVGVIHLENPDREVLDFLAVRQRDCRPGDIGVGEQAVGLARCAERL